MLTEKIRKTKIELIPYCTYFFFRTQNRNSNIINIKKHKNRIDLWGNFSVGWLGQFHFPFISSDGIPFLPGFGATKAAPSSIVWSEMDQFRGRCLPIMHYFFNKTTWPLRKEYKAEQLGRQTWLLPISFALQWYMAAEEEFLTISLLQAWGMNLVCQCLPRTANLIWEIHK